MARKPRANGDIDPAHVDVAQKPNRKRRPTRRELEPLPEHLTAQGMEALERMKARPATPGIMIEPDNEDGFMATSPWQQDDKWFALLADACGTRSTSVVHVLLEHLRGLCSESYDHQHERWKTSEMEWNAALAIVNASRPADELQAMQVAQMVAIHWMQMRHSGYALGRTQGWMDPKDAATSAILARTFVQQAEGLRRMKAKPRKIRQEITVRRDTHIHHHQHLHVEGGADQIEGRPCEPTPRTRRNTGLIGHASSPPLFGSNQTGFGVPVPGDEGPDTLPDSRRKGRRAKG